MKREASRRSGACCFVSPVSVGLLLFLVSVCVKAGLVERKTGDKMKRREVTCLFAALNSVVDKDDNKSDDIV